VIMNHLFVETRKPSNTPVLALGFTQRFRTKYVTVILHKPLQRLH
jgi:5'-AMP-activated protein kinase regulatory beta subunit